MLDWEDSRAIRALGLYLHWAVRQTQDPGVRRETLQRL